MNLRFKPIPLLFLLAMVTITIPTFAQLTDLARVEYTYFPQKDSDNSFRRARAFINIPIQLDDDAYLVTGLEYRNVHLKLQDSLPFSISDNERFQNMVLTIGFTDKLESGWRYALQGEARLASNFSTGDIIRDDLIFGGSFYFIKDRTGENLENPPDKPWRLILGLNYSTTAGRPFPLPFVNYYREFAPKWTYTAGVPKSNIKYEFVKNMKLQGFITLDGFFSNIQENEPVDNTQTIAENVSMTTLLSGLGYEWEFIDHFVFYVYAGHTLINDIRLRDSNGDDVFTINDTNTFYSRGGLKVKI
ncbi:DUF6268 family outer membrane beta-barrel protein [Marinirhabdus gelatinilytica]|uniref:DUF6268 domain-containing protein n=1 Tax=Marinirhabdus gelatinilytica TaxID=1703343 RepID=A0A370Q8S9_9FLAO|nr:DUF6268 family outer membrane beta-barrel protein [Marinirhabdus gelatinilytica]RDK84765.1 hypothetical protein C8D94_104138 [Marinirhabdus gelatinilytica]